MDDLKAARVPVLILSGGEPLLRRDIFEISARAKAMGFYVGLSSNGALIDEPTAERIARDRLRLCRHQPRRDRRRSTTGSAACRAPMTPRSPASAAAATSASRSACASPSPSAMSRACRRCSTSWRRSGSTSSTSRTSSTAGRGNRYRDADAHHRTTRAVMDLLFERCWTHVLEGRGTEFVTGNNDADGVYFLRWVERHFPERADHIRAKLEAWGGNASGVNVANIDNLGDVHPDTFWWHYSLGNVQGAAVRRDLGRRLRPDHGRSQGSDHGQLEGRCGVCRRASRSAAATRACARCGSTATPGPRTRPAT